ATLWTSPITVTTAVQFFETLGSNHPSRLRKLHELAGSAVFVDEAHAAIPSWLWPQAWLWLKELSEKWRCHFVFASGSLARFWELEKFLERRERIPDLVTPRLREAASEAERRRIVYLHNSQPLDRNELLRFILSRQGPRLVILNTVQSAAVVAHDLNAAGHSVLHLSTALTPSDRERIVTMVQGRLQTEADGDWTLVATSCVEAGMDFSFRTAFRESCSTASLIQTGGRVNRHGEMDAAEVWDLRVLDPLLTHNPAFETSGNVLERLTAEKRIEHASATECVTEAMRRELMSDYTTKTAVIKERERKLDYPEVDKLCRVIEADTRIVVVDKEVIAALEDGTGVSPQQLVRGSVQLYPHRVERLALELVRGHEELYKWTGCYDPELLGYMAELVPSLYQDT
ncbi:MAG: CRISPR-associated protein, partial [bacterium]|nr:CRISPR-associated protein [bacterium]